MYRAMALKVHRYMEDHFVQQGAVVGPDPGVRFNYRLWRFLKCYTPWIPWRDGLYYLQCQGYWVTANWLLARDCQDHYGQLALQATDQIVERQRPSGAWDYPNPEWKGRVATVEGIWAALALLASYRRSGRDVYLQRALKWHEYFSTQIGYQTYRGWTAVNYFNARPGNPVPNNSAVALRYLADLADATGTAAYRVKCGPMVDFLRQVQLPSGEFPYIVDEPRKRHFQCFQYHAFFYLDVLNYYLLSRDEQVLPMLRLLLQFLQEGVAADGSCYYQCQQPYRTVNYHTAAIAAALISTDHVCLSTDERNAYRALAERALGYLARRQAADGSFPHSRGDYRILADNRRYPRYLAMMLLHLLMAEPDDRVRSDKTQRESMPNPSDLK
jgi:hypothetical protein